MTTSVIERDHVLANLPNYDDEGIAFQAHPDPLPDTIPLYRFFHTQTGHHFYTANEAERDALLIADLFPLEAAPPYDYEGITYYVDKPSPYADYVPPEEAPLTLPGGLLPDLSLVGGGDGGA